MQTAQGSFLTVGGYVDLRHLSGQPLLLEFFPTPRAGKESPIVGASLEVYGKRTSYPCFREQHGWNRELPFVGGQSQMRTSGMGTTNFPPQSRIYAIWSMISVLRFQGRIST